jgi:hypothetical protein
LPVDQHTLGRIAHAALKREVDLQAALVLEDHAVDVGYVVVRTDHVTR